MFVLSWSRGITVTVMIPRSLYVWCRFVDAYPRANRALVFSLLWWQQAWFRAGRRDHRRVQHHHKRSPSNASKESLHVQPKRPSQGFSRYTETFFKQRPRNCRRNKMRTKGPFLTNTKTNVRSRDEKIKRQSSHYRGMIFWTFEKNSTRGFLTKLPRDFAF